MLRSLAPELKPISGAMPQASSTVCTTGAEPLVRKHAAGLPTDRVMVRYVSPGAKVLLPKVTPLLSRERIRDGDRPEPRGAQP